MGWPPNADNVPSSFWQEAEERRQREAFLVLYLMFLGSADFHVGEGDEDPLGLDLDDRLDGLATVYAEDASRTLARKYRERSEAAFNRLRTRLDATTSKSGESAMTKSEFEDELAKVAGPDRDAEAAATGTTGAQTAGGDAAISETQGGVSQADRWINQPHLTRTGPCERCEALHEKPRKDWASIDEFAGDGPPLHDHCACVVEYAAPVAV